MSAGLDAVNRIACLVEDGLVGRALLHSRPDLVKVLCASKLAVAVRVQQAEVGVQLAPVVPCELCADGVHGDVQGSPVRLHGHKLQSIAAQRMARMSSGAGCRASDDSSSSIVESRLVNSQGSQALPCLCAHGSLECSSLRCMEWHGHSTARHATPRHATLRLAVLRCTTCCCASEKAHLRNQQVT